MPAVLSLAKGIGVNSGLPESLQTVIGSLMYTGLCKSLAPFVYKVC